MIETTVTFVGGPRDGHEQWVDASCRWIIISHPDDWVMLQYRRAGWVLPLAYYEGEV